MPISAALPLRMQLNVRMTEFAPSALKQTCIAGVPQTRTAAKMLWILIVQKCNCKFMYKYIFLRIMLVHNEPTAAVHCLLVSYNPRRNTMKYFDYLILLLKLRKQRYSKLQRYSLNQEIVYGIWPLTEPTCDLFTSRYLVLSKWLD